MVLAIDFLFKDYINFEPTYIRKGEFPIYNKSYFRISSNDSYDLTPDININFNNSFKYKNIELDPVIVLYNENADCCSLLIGNNNNWVLKSIVNNNFDYNDSSNEHISICDLYDIETDENVGVIHIIKSNSIFSKSVTGIGFSDDLISFNSNEHLATFRFIDNIQSKDFEIGYKGLIINDINSNDKIIKVVGNKGNLYLQQYKKETYFTTDNEYSIEFNNGFNISYINGKVLDLTSFKLLFENNEDKLIYKISTLNNDIVFNGSLSSMRSFSPNMDFHDFFHMPLTTTNFFAEYFEIDDNILFGTLRLTLSLSINTDKNINWLLNDETLNNLDQRNRHLVNDDDDDDVVPNYQEGTTNFPFTPLFCTIRSNGYGILTRGYLNDPDYFGRDTIRHALASDSCNITTYWLKNWNINSNGSYRLSPYGPRDLPWDESNTGLGHFLDGTNGEWKYMAGIFSICHTRIRFGDGSTIMVNIGRGRGKSGFLALTSSNGCLSGSNNGLPYGSGSDQYGCDMGCGLSENGNQVFGNGGDWLVRGATDLYPHSLNANGTIPLETCKTARGVWRYESSNYTYSICKLNRSLIDKINEDATNIDASGAKVRYYWTRWYLYPNVPAYLPNELMRKGVRNHSVTGTDPVNFKFVASNTFRHNRLSELNSFSVEQASYGGTESDYGTNYTTVGEKGNGSGVCVAKALFDGSTDTNNGISVNTDLNGNPIDIRDSIKVNSNNILQYKDSSNREKYVYYGELVVHYKENDIFTPPQDCRVSNPLDIQSLGGSYKFTQDVSAVLRCACECTKIGGSQFIYTYSIHNFDFDPRISKISIPSSGYLDINTVKVYHNVYDEDTQTFFESKWRKELDSDSNLNIVCDSRETGEDIFDSNLLDTNTFGDYAFTDGNKYVLSFGTVLAIRFIAPTPPTLGYMNMKNYIPIYDGLSDMQQYFSNPCLEGCSIIDHECICPENITLEQYNRHSYVDQNSNSPGIFSMNMPIMHPSYNVIGDINLTGLQPTILDILKIISHILGNNLLTNQALINADINEDDTINILDVLGLVNIVLYKS